MLIVQRHKTKRSVCLPLNDVIYETFLVPYTLFMNMFASSSKQDLGGMKTMNGSVFFSENVILDLQLSTTAVFLVISTFEMVP